MPFYEYACTRCNHEFDVLKKMSDDPAETCPECGQAAHRKVSIPGQMRKTSALPSCGSRVKQCAPSGGG
jgi:putative FmdB family regulatory protein